MCSANNSFGNSGDSKMLPNKRVVWPFEGVLGSVDRQSAQRGAQVYFEVCSVCHGLDYLYYRNLKDIGFTENEISALSKSYKIIDGPNDTGEMFERSALPSDRIVPPFPNAEAAKMANNGALPPDLSLIVKSRPDGANYLFSLLTGYLEPPKDYILSEGLSYNPYFEGSQIAMPEPLMDDQVKFIDGTNATVEQMARDVTIFLQWAAEPEMEHRKSLGLKVVLYLMISTLVFYIAKNTIWARLTKV
nr:cytochrome c1 [Rickettsia endosymbiont of Cardiosporidium cionae]